MDKAGMITTQQTKRLPCVPDDLRGGVERAENTVWIRTKGVLKLDFDRVHLEDN